MEVVLDVACKDTFCLHEQREQKLASEILFIAKNIDRLVPDWDSQIKQSMGELKKANPNIKFRKGLDWV